MIRHQIKKAVINQHKVAAVYCTSSLVVSVKATQESEHHSQNKYYKLGYIILTMDEFCYSDVFRWCKNEIMASNRLNEPIFYRTASQLTFTCSKSIKNTRKRCEICSELTLKLTLKLAWRHSCVFIVNLEHISYLFLLLLLLTLNK